jgi:hypothetical protein
MGNPLGPFRPGSSHTSAHHDDTDPAGPINEAQTTPDRLALPDNAKVVGIADAHNQIGVYGFSQDNVGIRAESSAGVGLQAQGGAAAAVFEGDVRVSGQMRVNGPVQVGGSGTFAGDVEVRGDIRLINADVAEDFTVAEGAPVDPGTVMVLGDAGTVLPSRRAYDSRVVGVISGAGGYKPGIVLDGRKEGGRQPVALMGKVYCKVDAQYGAIDIGHLLTTSPTPGHAMRAGDPLQAFGTCLGKALAPLPEGQALIPILVTLQ